MLEDVLDTDENTVEHSLDLDDRPPDTLQHLAQHLERYHGDLALRIVHDHLEVLGDGARQHEL